MSKSVLLPTYRQVLKLCFDAIFSSESSRPPTYLLFHQYLPFRYCFRFWPESFNDKCTNVLYWMH